MTNQTLRKVAEAEAKREGYTSFDHERGDWISGFIVGRTSVTREQIAEELSKHHFVHGIGRSNSCHCGAQVGEFAEYRNHEADAILALLNGDTDD